MQSVWGQSVWEEVLNRLSTGGFFRALKLFCMIL